MPYLKRVDGGLFLCMKDTAGAHGRSIGALSGRAGVPVWRGGLADGAAQMSFP